MRTITFYSYKGGVGRSLLVANTAKYLSILGKSVFALDLDLEAPGLHYKFELGSDAPRRSTAPGVLDILSNFLKNRSLPESLGGYTTQVDVPNGAGDIHLMWAGTAPDANYWRMLSQVNWYDLFYGNEPVGVPFFLELQQRISREFNPDFVLIDARTGITDMGGVAITLLPDTVVCLALASAEHLEGLRAVMRGIRQTTSQRNKSVRVVPVISRFLSRRESADENQELEKVRSFLNAPIGAGLQDLGLDEVVALHSEPLLDSEEQLLVGGKNSPHELPLLRDYLKLFSKIIPAEDIRPHVGQLIQRAISRLLDDPDGTQSDLEALTTYCADQEAFRSLLKLYLIRNTAPEKIVATAALMRQFSASGSVPDRLLQDVVRLTYKEPRPGDIQRKYVDFAEDIWRSGGMSDVPVVLCLAEAMLPDRPERAARLLSDYIDKTEPPNYAAIVKLLNVLRAAKLPNQAFGIIERFKAKAEVRGFHTAWARLAVERNDNALAQQTLSDPSFRLDAVRAVDPVTVYRLLKLSGSETPFSFLVEALNSALSSGDLSGIRELAEVFQEEGRIEDFEMRARAKMSDRVVDDIVERARVRQRHDRFFR